ncbi:MAG: hypothetical protein ABEK59_01430 [Halobacteria archaeon]
MGSRTERLLLEDIEEKTDYTGIRVDFGGGAGYHNPHDAGDLLVSKPVDGLSSVMVIEEKYKSTDANRYLQEDGMKFDAMIEFAEAMGATPVLACRWSSNLEWSPGAEHYLTDAREVERTSAGNISVKPETATQWKSAEEFFG